jgi:hypothetical protein
MSAGQHTLGRERLSQAMLGLGDDLIDVQRPTK